MKPTILVGALLTICACKADPAPSPKAAELPANPGLPPKAAAPPADSGPTSSAAAKPADPVLAAMIGFKDRTCACKDEACLDAVNKDMNKFANDQVINPLVSPATQEHSNQMLVVSKQLTDCIVKVMSQP